MTTPVLAPRGPILDWGTLFGNRTVDVPALDDAPFRLFTTSGRAALELALRALQLPLGTPVWVPSYHCPTMVAPIVHAGMVPRFYPLQGDGFPALHLMDTLPGPAARAMIVPHLFGFARPLGNERQWCDQRGISLIEDCAHCYFGHAGERPVGAWGDLAIGSITKFFPVTEAGVLVSYQRELPSQILPAQGWLSEAKALARLVVSGIDAGSFQGLGWALKATQAARPQPSSVVTAPPSNEETLEDPLQGCDMSRSATAPLRLNRFLARRVPRGDTVRLRRQNFQTLQERLAHVRGCRVMADLQAHTVPYALPLWVDHADRLYAGLRAQGFAVFRWDYFWHGTPELEADAGPMWRRHVLQLLCHQSLTSKNLQALADAVAALLAEAAQPAAA